MIKLPSMSRGLSFAELFILLAFYKFHEITIENRNQHYLKTKFLKATFINRDSIILNFSLSQPPDVASIKIK